MMWSFAKHKKIASDSPKRWTKIVIFLVVIKKIMVEKSLRDPSPSWSLWHTISNRPPQG